MSYTVVTTFNALGYTQYAKRMIQTFLKNWPSTVNLTVYTEDCLVAESATNLCVRDLHASSPELISFKKQWQHVPRANGDVSQDPVRNQRKDAGKGFKWDAVRFSHKVYAVFHCARTVNTDWLVWMDADTVCHSALTETDLNRLIPADRDLCFLGRQGKYSECGLYALNLHSVAIQQFLKEFQRCYDHAEQGIFQLPEWHDSYVFDAVRKKIKCKELDWSQGMIKGEGHPLINSEWGAYLDHLKGDRKRLGRSKSKDLMVNRTESYWQ